MAKISIWNIGKANAELNAAQDSLAPALAKAGISTIAFEGKTVPAGDAPLSAQISALLAAQPVVADSQNAAEALVSNELISKELESTKTELALKTTAVEGLTRDKAALQTKLTAAEATVQDLTVKNTTLTQERDACSSQFSAANKQVTAMKTALAQDCIDCQCLDLKGDDGKPLAADASNDVKLAAALKLSSDDLRKSFKGAVNAALAKTNVSLFAIPAGKPAGAAEKTELKGRARFIAAGLAQSQTTTTH